MANHPNRKLPRLTKEEWDAIHSALSLVLAGEDPWEDEATEERDSPTFEAMKTARAKVAQRR